MNIKWVIGLVMIFILGSMLSGIMELQFLSGDANQQSVIEGLFGWANISGSGLYGVAESIIVATPGVIGSFFQMLVWDYAFFDGSYQIIRWVVCMPITAGMLYGLFMVIRGS